MKTRLVTSILINVILSCKLNSIIMTNKSNYFNIEKEIYINTIYEPFGLGRFATDHSLRKKTSILDYPI